MYGVVTSCTLTQQQERACRHHTRLSPRNTRDHTDLSAQSGRSGADAAPSAALLQAIHACLCRILTFSTHPCAEMCIRAMQTTAADAGRACCSQFYQDNLAGAPELKADQGNESSPSYKGVPSPCAASRAQLHSLVSMAMGVRRVSMCDAESGGVDSLVAAHGPLCPSHVNTDPVTHDHTCRRSAL